MLDDAPGAPGTSAATVATIAGSDCAPAAATVGTPASVAFGAAAAAAAARASRARGFHLGSPMVLFACPKPETVPVRLKDSNPVSIAGSSLGQQKTSAADGRDGAGGSFSHRGLDGKQGQGGAVRAGKRKTPWWEEYQALLVRDEQKLMEKLLGRRGLGLGLRKRGRGGG